MFLALLEYEKYCKDSEIDPSKGQQRFLNALVTKCPPEASNLMKLYYSSMKDVQSIMTLNLKVQKHLEAGSYMARHALLQSDERDRLSFLKVSAVDFENTTFVKWSELDV